MPWNFFWAAAAVLVILLIAVLIFICRKLFEIGIVRGEREMLGDEGFKGQLKEHMDEIEKGLKLYDSLEKEDVYIESFDKLKLHGVYIKNGDGKRLIIEAHGYRSGARHDFCAAMPYFYDKGFSFLLIDQRAHGKSEGEHITFGVHERVDLCDWVNFAVDKIDEDTEILLHGISMGATTVLMASVLGLPSNVKGIIADSGFTSPYDIFVRVLDHTYHAKPFPLLNIAGMIAEYKANFGFKDASAVDAMAENTLPVLFVHGEDDDFVPIEMSEASFEACTAEKSFVRVKGARHGCSYLVDKKACEDAMDSFLAKIF